MRFIADWSGRRYIQQRIFQRIMAGLKPIS
jgi:hypothetical protein